MPTEIFYTPALFKPAQLFFCQFGHNFSVLCSSWGVKNGPLTHVTVSDSRKVFCLSTKLQKICNQSAEVKEVLSLLQYATFLQVEDFLCAILICNSGVNAPKLFCLQSLSPIFCLLTRMRAKDTFFQERRPAHKIEKIGHAKEDESENSP